MQIDVAPTDHRAVLDGRQQFLSVLNVFLLGNFLGEIQVVPADNGIFYQVSWCGFIMFYLWKRVG